MSTNGNMTDILMNVAIFIGEMVVMLGLGPLDTQPYIHLIALYIGYLSGIYHLLKGSLGGVEQLGFDSSHVGFTGCPMLLCSGLFLLGLQP